MSTEELLTLILVIVVVLLVIAVLGAAGMWLVLLRFRRSRGGGRINLRRAGPSTPEHTPVSNSAPQPMPAMSPGRSADRDAVPATHGDVPADDPRILALGLEKPDSTEAVFRNLERIKPLLGQEATESDRMSRITPLAGRALRSAGLFLWGFPQARGGVEVSFADRLEAITQLARIDMGMAWVTQWLTAHGDIAGRLSDHAFAEIYPSLDLPTVFSATPMARAVEVAGDKYRIEKGIWRLGSGGYHCERWMGGAKVWDASGEPVICEITGEHKEVGIWLPPNKVHQDNDWDPMGLRSSGSASYRLTEPVEVPRSWSFNVGAERRPYFFPFMGVMVGAAEHLIDLTLESLRAKHRAGVSPTGYDKARLSKAMSALDMLVLGLRGHAQYIDQIISVREGGEATAAEAAWLENIGVPVRETVCEIVETATDIYGTGYVASGSEFGRVLRDLKVAQAHTWFRLTDTQLPRGNRVTMMLEDPATAPIWDCGWPIQIAPEDHRLGSDRAAADPVAAAF